MLVNCSECKQSISTRAAKCPHCGAPRRAGFQDVWEKRVGPVVGSALLIGFLAYCSHNSSDNSTAAVAAVAPPVAQTTTTPPPVPTPALPNFSKPIFTRENAVICPVTSFENQLAGHSVADVKRLFDEPGSDLLERQVHASVQDCSVYQGGIRVATYPRDLRPGMSTVAKGLHQEVVAELLNSKDWVVLQDVSSSSGIDGSLCCLITRADQIRN
jgi:hypothetical protein